MILKLLGASIQPHGLPADHPVRMEIV